MSSERFSGAGAGSNKKELHSQIGFYLLPPEAGPEAGGAKAATNSKRRSKKNQASASKPVVQENPRRWASQNQLDAILEASDESGPTFEDDFRQLRLSKSRSWRNSSPARLIRDNTPQPGLLMQEGSRDQPPMVLSGERMAQRNGRHSQRVPDRHDHYVNPAVASIAADCTHPQARICTNLKYNLQNQRHTETYMSLVDAIVSGPQVVRSSEAEYILGIGPGTYLRSRNRGKFPMAEDGDDFDDDMNSVMFDSNGYYSENGDVARRKEAKNATNKVRRQAIRELFMFYARLGDPHSNGQHITLAQTEKWLRQADVIDNWNLTTTDTAIAYRKISRGSKWLDYDSWRTFLEELAWRKKLNINFVLDKIVAAGKPTSNH